MNETSIPEAPLRFEYRNDINQFLRDGVMITALYGLTLQLLHTYFPNIKNETDKMLKIFNAGYHYCWLATETRLKHSEITNLMCFVCPGDDIHILSIGVAWSILKLQRSSVVCHPMICISLGQKLSNFRYEKLFKAYSNFVTSQTQLAPPISFQAPSGPIADPVVKANSNSNQRHDTIKDECMALKEKIKTLETNIRKQEEEHKKNTDTLNAIISQLKEKRRILQEALDRSNAQIQKHQKENEIFKLFSPDAIGDYALSLGNARDVQVIYVMLNRISTRNRYFDESLNKVIEKIERHQHALEQHKFGATFNFNEGSSYNDIHDNHDSTINTNG